MTISTRWILVGLAGFGTAGLGCSGPTATSTVAESCSDVQANAVDETGDRPANGTYTLYVNGDESQPWEVYCHDMSRAEPKDFLSVTETTNYSQLSNGVALTVTHFRRLRIDPDRLELDPLDDTFATTEEADDEGGFPPPVMPADRTHVPAGWAEFAALEKGNLRAHARVDLTGTSFAFDEAVEDEGYFCKHSTGGGDDAASEIEVSNDLSSFTLTAINAAAGPTTRVVADCDNLTAAVLDEAAIPLAYVGL